MDAHARKAAVRTIARDGDADRYASALFARQQSREHLFALYAFNVKTGAPLWTQPVDTSSSIWGGYYGSSTVSQVNGLAETITNAVKSKI